MVIFFTHFIIVTILNSNYLSSFEAKNVPQDKLRLRVPVWITCLSFLGADNKVVTGTAYKHMRVYDTKADRRPIMSIDIGITIHNNKF